MTRSALVSAAAASSASAVTIRQMHHQGDLAIVEVDEAYSNGSGWKTAFILDLQEGLNASLTGDVSSLPSAWLAETVPGSSISASRR